HEGLLEAHCGEELRTVDIRSVEAQFAARAFQVAHDLDIGLHDAVEGLGVADIEDGSATAYLHGSGNTRHVDWPRRGILRRKTKVDLRAVDEACVDQFPVGIVALARRTRGAVG